MLAIDRPPPRAYHTGTAVVQLPEAATVDSKRRANERKFGNWEPLPSGGRRYWYDVQGKGGWRARYVKEVDSVENTSRFYQEIYDQSGELVEVHEKFPEDLGHLSVKEF